MSLQILTIEDLLKFKTELIGEIKELLEGVPAKRYLRSSEVRDIFRISPGTLQNMRINGKIPYTKLGNTIFYDYQEILKILENNNSS